MAKWLVHCEVDCWHKSCSFFQSNEVKNSNAMETEGLKRNLRKVEDLALEIKSLTTDRHIEIRKFLREEKPHIKQWFDCWHIAKSKQSVSILAQFFILPLFNPSPSVRVICFLSPFQPLAIHFITSHIKLSANIMRLYSLPHGLSLPRQSINMVSNRVISPPQCPSVHTTQCHNPHKRYDNYHRSKSSNVVLLNDFRCGERAVTEGQEKGPGTDPFVGSLDQQPPLLECRHQWRGRRACLCEVEEYRQSRHKCPWMSWGEVCRVRTWTTHRPRLNKER